MTQGEWVELLERLLDCVLLSSGEACVVQSLVDDIWYDIGTHDNDGLIPGEYHVTIQDSGQRATSACKNSNIEAATASCMKRSC